MASSELFPSDSLFQNVFDELKLIIANYYKYVAVLECEKRKDYNNYFITLTDLADNGCILSQKKLINDYILGNNVHQDHLVTAGFYRKNEDKPFSCGYVGWMYSNGNIGRINTQEAIEYYEKAMHL